MKDNEASAPGLSDEQILQFADECGPGGKENRYSDPWLAEHYIAFARSILTRASAAAVAEPSELEMHRADYQAVREAGFHDPGELLDAYKKLQAAQQQAEPGADERAAFLSRMDALDLKEFRELTGCQSPADYRMKLEDLHGDGESLSAEYLQDKVFDDMRLMYKAMGEFDNKAVARFAKAMKRKMAASRKKGRSGWEDPAQCSPERLAQMLIDHLAKGDPVDIGNFAMMLFNRPDAAGALARAAPTQQQEENK